VSIVGPRGYIVAAHLFPPSPLLALSDGNHNIHSRFVRILHVVLFSSYQLAPFIHLKILKRPLGSGRVFVPIGITETLATRSFAASDHRTRTQPLNNAQSPSSRIRDNDNDLSLLMTLGRTMTRHKRSPGPRKRRLKQSRRKPK
jgi:hypothetical protein